MHITGKILNWFVALAAIAALLLTSRMLEARNSRTKQLRQVEVDLDEMAEDEPSLVQRVRGLKGDVDRIELAWGRSLEGGAAGLDGAGNATSIRVPLPPGKGGHAIAANTKIHAFKTSEDGSAVYAGRFRVTNQSPDLLVLQPDFLVRSNAAWLIQASSDAAIWGGPGTWRIRKQIPPSNVGRFASLETSLNQADERLVRTQNQLVASQNRKTEAGVALNSEETTLVGGDELAANEGKLSEEFVLGLVKAIEAAESERNVGLSEVHELRKKRTQAEQRLRNLQQANKRAAQTLPDGSPPAKVTASAP
ncbi:MAG: hypothetical protein CMJ48_07110 [Planctomycetaceae bacterium]|nr:hypothetical protein [Planctomycetaceae bacterium]